MRITVACSLFSLALLAALCTPAAYASPSAPARAHRHKRYVGAFFTIDCPANFHARAAQKSLTMIPGTDAALFTSPDDKVQFYVFSPQWNGESNYLRLARGEALVSERCVRRTFRGSEGQDELPWGASGIPEDEVRVNWATVRSKRGGYWRSWKEYRNVTRGTQFVFGIRYRDRRSLKRYRNAYLSFRRSLEQFAD